MKWFVLSLSLMWLGCMLYVGACVLVLHVDQQLRPELSLNAVARFFREVGSLFFHNLLAPFGLWEPAPRPSGALTSRDGQPPALLIPGHGRNRSYLFFIAEGLRRRGWRWVWAINNRPSDGSIPAMAQELGRKVELLKQASGAPQVDLIGHSLGGVVATWYINHLNGLSSVRRLVTIATPWGGTRLAILALRRNGVQLTPGSGIMAHLGLPAAATTSIWTRQDTVIIPAESAAPEGITDRVEVPEMGHEQLLLSPAVLDIIVQRLSVQAPGQR